MARINSRQVEAFRATMLTGSVTEAAALMTVTQPAVSRLLRDLQALLKMELFERRGTGLVPTAAAMALYTEVERSFVGLERITAAAEEIRGLWQWVEAKLNAGAVIQDDPFVGDVQEAPLAPMFVETPAEAAAFVA